MLNYDWNTPKILLLMPFEAPLMQVNIDMYILVLSTTKKHNEILQDTIKCIEDFRLNY